MSKVDPQSLQARIVELADLLVTDATFWEYAGHYKPDADDPVNRDLFYSDPGE